MLTARSKARVSRATALKMCAFEISGLPVSPHRLIRFGQIGTSRSTICSRCQVYCQARSFSDCSSSPAVTALSLAEQPMFALPKFQTRSNAVVRSRDSSLA
ncbi:hypothetical protein VUR80DRAFT_6567 [Thermomyces stellatus]